MTFRPLVLLIAFLLLSVTVSAIDLNTMSEAELSAYITNLINEQQSQLPQEPVIVQIKSDEALNRKIDLLVSELGELKNTNERLQEKFLVLTTDFDTKLLATEGRISSDVKTEFTSQISEMGGSLQVFVREQTNPVRMNLPSIGVFLMATALFLILISRTYSFKGKETSLVSEEKKKEKEDKEEKEKKKKEKKEENNKALQELIKAQKIISDKIGELKNG